MTDQIDNANSIAIIGMAGRFPGARNIEELWQLLKSGGNAVTTLSDAELQAAGVSPVLLKNPNYVKTCVKLDGYDRFDAEFFGYSPRQATSLDPQGRLFLECAWESLEHAGYDPETFAGVIGIFAGSGTNHYLQRYLQEILTANGNSRDQTALDGEKDFLPLRVSYKLGLNGPGVAVQSACSTSLTAVHLACQSLLTFESDLVLAGAVSIQPDQDRGYLYEEGGIVSRDGVCRPYDADATGTIVGSGCGVVVLRRLEDAIREGDEIHAVIRATAINNDGADKAGFSAPGIKAQTRLIASALGFAGLQPTDIGMIEGHGTGTVLGDAVELTALHKAFNCDTTRQKWCALGSIKSNIGHLDTAAGMAGLIKTVLCLKHGSLVPSLNFARPNPMLESASSPFFVNTVYRPWDSAGKPRRAGVSALGIGGTNAHVILEEAAPPATAPAAATPRVFPLSAHTRRALQQLCEDLARYVEERPQLDLADVAYTLQTGRRRFACRRAIVAATRAELIRALREPVCGLDEHLNRSVIFMFPGQGAQTPGAVRALYDSQPFFRARVDECAALFLAQLGLDVRPLICHGGEVHATSSSALSTQPVVFTVGYSLARLWIHWGVTPSGLVGHSLGEYIAACIAGVLSLQDCVRLLACRARLVEAQPPGAMLAVGLPVDECRALLTGSLSIAAVNSPSQCVLSGVAEDIDAVSRVLTAREVVNHRLAVSRAFHSCLMDRAMVALEEAARGCHLESPHLPYISCVTGKRATGSEVTQPEFWAQHLREPVNFAAALASATADGSVILLEVGSGHVLCSLARQQLDPAADGFCLESLVNAGESDQTDLLGQLGRLWCAGARIDWLTFNQGAPRRRVGLVAYPFQRQRYWIQAARPESVLPAESLDQPPPPLRQTVPAETKADGNGGDNGWTALEASIAALWEEVLGVDTITRDSTFLSLGGDSLIALRVIARINDQFGVVITPQVLISPSGTIDALSRELVARLAGDVDAAQMTRHLEALGE